MGDFNLDLLHYETHNQSRDFFDKMFSASLKLHIAIPFRVAPQSKTLTDNIFTKFLDEDIVCGNLASTSEYIAQFLIYINKAVSDQGLRKDTNIKYFRNFDKYRLESTTGCLRYNDSNISEYIFLKSVNSILDVFP